MTDVNGAQHIPSMYGDARRIEWEGDFPTDLRAIVEPVFTPLEPLIPTWCQTVIFRYSPNEDSTLKIELSIRNRWALLRICAPWFACSAVEREGSMIHEWCHALVEPLNWNAARALDAYGPEEGTQGHRFADQMFRDGLEQAVEDMARAFHKVLRASR